MTLLGEAEMVATVEASIVRLCLVVCAPSLRKLFAVARVRVSFVSVRKLSCRLPTRVRDNVLIHPLRSHIHHATPLPAA